MKNTYGSKFTKLPLPHCQSLISHRPFETATSYLHGYVFMMLTWISDLIELYSMVNSSFPVPMSFNKYEPFHIVLTSTTLTILVFFSHIQYSSLLQYALRMLQHHLCTSQITQAGVLKFSKSSLDGEVFFNKDTAKLWRWYQGFLYC